MKACAAAIPKENRVKLIELCVFLALVLCINIPLMQGERFSPLMFMPDRVSAGQWWRILTHPFVHVSWYHLLIDGTAFVLLYRGLMESSWRRRAAYAAACAIGSLGVSMLSPAIYTGGLCGLSGAAHGLMAVSSLELGVCGKSRALRRAGLVSLLLVAGKSMIEAVSGQVMFSCLHIGDLGTPLTLSHAGGTLAGIAAFVGLRRSYFTSFQTPLP